MSHNPITPQGIANFLDQFESLERLAPSELKALQTQKLQEIASYAKANSPYYRDLDLNNIPLLSRRDLQSRGEDIFVKDYPAHHGGAGLAQTSGSSGVPVKLYKTAINQLFWFAHTLREHIWQGRDFEGRLAAIRANLATPQPQIIDSWGAPADLLFKTGKAMGLPNNLEVGRQIEWLQKFDPHYLIVYPNNLAALLDAGFKTQSLKQIKTIGESLSPALRARAQNELGVKIYDNYSSQELGNIALQCPHSGLYHIMAENLIVEIIKDDGKPASEGETGRVIVTDLYNYASPLLRYDIGDYAAPGPACSCGRTLPTLTHISGRERNMIYHNGERSWPIVGFHRYREVAPIIQYQLIQHEEFKMEMRLVTARALSPAEEEALRSIVREALKFAPEITFTYFEGEIPRGPGGKFEEFICKISP